MENQANKKVGIKRTSSKREYLVVVGIIKAVICFTALVIWAKYYDISSYWFPSIAAVVAPLFIAIVVTLLLVVDIYMVAITQNRNVSLNVTDAFIVNSVAMALPGFVLYCIIVFSSTNFQKNLCRGNCEGLVLAVLSGIGILYIAVTPLTILILCKKRLSKRAAKMPLSCKKSLE